MSNGDKSYWQTLRALFDTWEELVLAGFAAVVFSTVAVMLFAFVHLEKDLAPLNGLLTLLLPYLTAVLGIVVGGKKGAGLVEALKKPKQ